MPEHARVVIVGASSGLGRAIGAGLAKKGHRVAFLGRRLQRVQEAAAQAGSDAVGIPCDVRDEASCTESVEAACSALGGLDTLIYCAGIGPLALLVDTSRDTWRDVLATNVIGAAMATRVAMPQLVASRGRAIYLSSVAASLTPPWPGLGAYAVSKAALDKLVEAWRGEHPEVRFTRLIVGDSAGGSGDAASEFASGWEPALSAQYLAMWLDRGYLTGGLVPVDELVAVVAELVETNADVASVAVTPPR